MLKQIETMELAKMAIALKGDETLDFSTSDGDGGYTPCFIICVEHKDTMCLMVSHQGEGSANAINVTTYFENLLEICDWLNSFRSAAAIFIEEDGSLPDEPDATESNPGIYRRQYTGYRDKNKVAIFVGDTVKWIDSDGNVRTDTVKCLSEGTFVLGNSAFGVMCYLGKGLEVVMPRPGRMFVDVDAKIAAAATQEEKDAWESKREWLDKTDTDFCEGWHVGIYKHACGHWEVLQSPLYNIPVKGWSNAEADAIRELREHSASARCSRCQCN